jgi:hypothetical protein
MRLLTYQEWQKKFEENLEELHRDLTEKIISRQAKKDSGYRDQFVSIIFRICYGAYRFKGTPKDIDALVKKRRKDKLFADKSKNEINNSIGKIIAFLEDNTKGNTSALHGSMVLFALTLQDKEILFCHKNQNSTICDLLISTLSTLQDALQTDGRRGSELHRRKYGCFLYPHTIDDGSTAEPHNMLAVYLSVLMRRYTSGQNLRCAALLMSGKKIGRPHHDIVNDLVTFVFPNEKVNAKYAEDYFLKNVPGLKLVPWE